MEKKRAGVLSQSIAPYLFGLYFVVYQSSGSFYSFNLFGALLFLTVYSIVIASISAIFASFFSVKHTAISILVFAILVLFEDVFRYGMKYELSLFNFRNRYYLLCIFCFFILLVYIESKIMSRYTGLPGRVNKYCNVLLLFLILIAFCNGLYTMYDEYTREAGASKAMKKDTGIVWVLMDEYPSSASLSRHFNYVNPLDSLLTQQHFILLDTIRSRYSATLFSVSAIFNYDDSVPPKSFASSIYNLKRSKWVADIRKSRYQFFNLDFLTIGNHDKLMDIFYFPDTYSKQLLYGSLFFYAVGVSRAREIDQYNTLVNKSLDSVLRKDPDGYKLIWAHFLIPHVPYFRNSHGELLKDNGEVYDSATAKRRFIDYLNYGNSLIEALLKEHPVLQNKIVIISGDHGVRFTFVNKADWPKPYCAIHFPAAFDTASLKKLRYISQLPGWLANQ